MKKIAVALSAALVSTAAVSADASPYIVIEDDISVSLLSDFGTIGMPTGLLETRASGKITGGRGVDHMIGLDFSFDSGSFSGGLLGDLVIDGTGVYMYSDAFALMPVIGPTTLKYEMTFEPPFSEAIDVPSPGQSTVSFPAPFDFFPTEVIDTTDILSTIIKTLPMTITFEGPLPTRFFDDGLGGFDYIEGSVNATKIEIGTPSVVPLPASLGLLLAGLGAIGTAGRFRSSGKLGA